MTQAIPQQTPPANWKNALLILALLGWMFVGFIIFVQQETPHGRLAIKVVAQESGLPLANASIYLTQGDQNWSYTTDKTGSFSLASMPSGSYKVTADSRAHRLKESKFILQEGEEKALTLALPPVQPFLELIQPQPVFLPNEKAKIGLRGFTPASQIGVEVFRVRVGADPNVAISDIFELLDNIRLGWWQGEKELQQKLVALGSTLESVQRSSVSIVGRDAEGVFLQYIDFPLHALGTYLVQLRAGGLRQTALVIVTETGLVLKSTGDQEILAWTNHLKTGIPTAGLQVSLWGDRRLAGVTYSKRLATSTTLQDGLVRLRLPANHAGVGQIYAVAYQKGQPVAWVSQSLSDAPASLNGYLYSERPVYRPGNLVHLKGIVRRQGEQGYVSLNTGTNVTLIVKDPDNNILKHSALKLSTFNSFAADVQLNEEAKVGYYSVTAEVGGQEVNGSFEVSAYHKPTFAISLTPQKKFYTSKDQVALALDARYYFGLPVGQSQVRYTVYRLPLYEWASADDAEEDVNADSEGNYGDYGEYVLEGTTTTDDNGQALIRFKASDFPAPKITGYWSDSPKNYRYTVSATVQAAGDEYADAKTGFSVVQGNLRVSLSTDPYFAQPNTPIKIKVNLQDRNSGKPQSASLRWRAGTFNWTGKGGQVEWQGDAQSVQASGTGEATFQFSPPKIGDWVIEVQTEDKEGNTISEQTSVWISTYGEGTPQAPDAPPLKVLTDKRSYAIGDTAKVAVRSQVKNASVLITVEGEKLHNAQVVQLRGGLATITVPITNKLMPSATISASLVQDKRLAQQSIPLRIGTQARQMQVTITSDRQRYEPRQQAELTVQTRTADGKPVKSELSLAVVDESLYAIREDNPKGLFDAFYARRPNRVETQYSFPWIALQGDKGSGDTVRRNFPDTAFWLPQVVTDANGLAKVKVTLPDNLTQWRVTGMAQSQDLQVGYGVQRFVSAKEFAVRLSVPTVLTEGDEVTVSAVVSNNGDREHAGTVKFLAGNAVQTSDVRVAPKASQTVQWTYKVAQVGQIPLQVRLSSPDGFQDAEERTVSALPHASQQLTTGSLTLTGGQTDFELQAAPGYLSGSSQLSIRLAPSIFSQLLGTLDYLVEYPYGCTEQTMSRFLPSLAVMRVLEQKGIAIPELQKRTPDVIQKGLTRLYRFQHSDGGWGWWENDSNDLYMTAYVMHGLAIAQSSGVTVNPDVLRLGRESLQAQVTEQWKQGFGGKNQERYRRDTYAFAVYALALSGGNMPNTEADLLKFSDQLTPYGQAMLVLALDHWNHSQSAGQIVAQLLDEQQSDSIGAFWKPTIPATVNVKSVDTWFHHEWLNETETTAWVVRALLAHNQSLDPQSLESSVHWILAHRQAQGWESTKDSAAAIEALLAYTQRTEQPLSNAAQVQVMVNGNNVGQVNFDAQSLYASETVLKIPATQIHAGNNQVRFVVAGSNTPVYANIVLKQSVRLEENAPQTVSGPLKLERTYALLRSTKGSDGSLRFEETALKDNEAIPTGTLVRVHVRVTGWKNGTDASHLILEDPLPGGFRATDDTLPSTESANSDYSSYTTEVRDDRIIGYYLNVWGKTLEFDYLLRAEVPGTYHVLPSRLWNMYSDWRLNGQEMHLRITP
jgi:alpha-2-macroglobulin